MGQWQRARYPLQQGLPGSSQGSQAVPPVNSTKPSTMDKSTGRDQSCPVRHESVSDNGKTEVDSIFSRSSSPLHFHREATTSPQISDHSEEPRSPLQGPGSHTLRRSPRSKLLQAQISLADLVNAVNPFESTEKTSDSATADEDDRERAEHSPQYGPTLSSKPHGPPPKYESNNAFQPNEASRTLPALPVSPPDSDSEADNKHQQAPGQKADSNLLEQKTSTWTRRGYPLQIRVGRLDLKRPHTPPSPTRTLEQPTPTTQNLHAPTQAGKTTSLPLNGNYPLQSPVISASNQASPAPPALDPARDRAQLVAQPTPAKGPVTSQKKGSQRQTYPLQSPASVANLQQSKSSPVQADPKNVSQSSTSSDKVPAQQMSVQRQKYPLQSSASVADLKRSQDPTAASSGPTQHKDNVKAPTPTAAFRRRAYPLQSPASSTNLRTSSPPLEQQDSAPVKKPHRNEYANQSPSQSLRRQSYPLQSLVGSDSENFTHSPLSSRVTSSSSTNDGRHHDESANYYSPPPSYALTRRGTRDEVTGKILLPKNLRAVSDAEKPLRGRTIVVCLDGTGDKFDDDNSNIVHIVSALKKDDPNQVTYYQAGIGTYNDGGLSTGFDAAMDMAVGSGLGLHIRDAYHFLMHSYKEGDRICIFGFSRGAYTARCLAGMIHKVGLLPPRNIQQIMFAYDFYKQDTEIGWERSADFKRAFSIDVNVHFLGCFDSVASVGFIPRQLPLSSTPTNKARYFRHAMALDERRAKFKICRFQSAKDQGELDVEEETSPTTKLLGKVPHSHNLKDTPPKYSATEPYGKNSHYNLTDAEYERIYSHDDAFDTDVKEVWFAGCHADIGGGAVANTERHKLAQIPLRWMIRQAFECNTGIIFKTRSLAEYGLDVHTLWPQYGSLDVPSTSHAPPADFLSRYKKALPPKSIRRQKLVPVEDRMADHNQDDKHHHHEPLFQLNSHDDEDWTPEQVEDYYDAMTKINDQLVDAPIWWILEAMPVQYKLSPQHGQITVHTGPNMGLARLVEDYEAHIHWTVLQRAQQMGYKAAARPAKHTEWKVVT